MQNEGKAFFPAAVYSKRLDSALRSACAYNWIERHPGFSDTAAQHADGWIQRFQWRYGRGNAHPPVAVWVPLQGGALMLRFTDAGKDDQGRPHMLRLEAAWSESPSSELRAAFLLSAVGQDPWLDDGTGQVRISLEEQVPEALAHVLQGANQEVPTLASTQVTGFALDNPNGPALFAIDATTWLPFSGLMGISAANTPMSTIEAVEAGRMVVTAPAFQASNYDKKPRLHLYSLYVAVALLLTSLLGAGVYIKLHIDSLEADLVRHKDEINEQEEEVSKLNESLDEARKELAAKNASLMQLESDKDSEIAILNAKIDGLEKNAEEATRQRADGLEKVNETLQGKLDTASQKLQQIHELSRESDTQSTSEPSTHGHEVIGATP
jgi:hypothetical protein